MAFSAHRADAAALPGLRAFEFEHSLSSFLSSAAALARFPGPQTADLERQRSSFRTDRGGGRGLGVSGGQVGKGKQPLKLEN